jgi:hypothetical protein
MAGGIPQTCADMLPERGPLNGARSPSESGIHLSGYAHAVAGFIATLSNSRTGRVSPPTVTCVQARPWPKAYFRLG